MKVCTLIIDPNNYDDLPYLYGIYENKDKAEEAMRVCAIEGREPALALSKEYDTWECADCWHYPDYEHSRYYIKEWEVE